MSFLLCIGADCLVISLLTGAFLKVYSAYVDHITTHSYSVLSPVLFPFIGQFITHLQVWMNLIKLILFENTLKLCNSLGKAECKHIGALTTEE